MNPTPTIQLASGRLVTHSPEPNGSQLAMMLDGQPMSEDEWREYCRRLAAMNSAQIAEKRAEQSAANRKAFEADIASRKDF